MREYNVTTEPQAVAAIQNLMAEDSTDPNINLIAHQITDPFPERSDKIYAIHKWMWDNFEYIPDADNADIFTEPSVFIDAYLDGKEIGDDCEEFAMLTEVLLRAVGITSRIILVDQTGGGLDHAFCQVLSDKLGWTNCDASSKLLPLGWEIKSYQNVFIN